MVLAEVVWGSGERSNGLVTQVSLLSGNCVPQFRRDLWHELEQIDDIHLQASIHYPHPRQTH